MKGIWHRLEVLEAGIARLAYNLILNYFVIGSGKIFYQDPHARQTLHPSPSFYLQTDTCKMFTAVLACCAVDADPRLQAKKQRQIIILPKDNVFLSKPYCLQSKLVYL